MKKGIAAAVFTGLGIWIKNSYQVILIAMIITLLVDILSSFKDNKKVITNNIIVIAAVLIFTAGIGKVSDTLLENRLGFKLGEGSPMISWITMAFGEEENGDPVRYDGYNMRIYLDNDADTKKAEAKAREDLAERIKGITDTPSHFIRFMGKKIARCWNDPTFESIAVNGKGAETAKHPEILKKILKEDGTSPIVIFDNILHSLILMGVLLYIVYRIADNDKVRQGELFLCLSFVGGFLFLLFWETLSQYAMVYFLMLIPVSVAGFDAFTDDITACIYGKKRFAAIGIISLILLTAAFLPSNSLKEALHPSHQEDIFWQAVADNEIKMAELEGAVPDGKYRISPLLYPGYGIASLGSRAIRDEEIPGIELMPADDINTGIINVYHEFNYDLLRIDRTQYLLSAPRGPYSEEETLEHKEREEAAFLIPGQDQDDNMWKLIPATASNGETCYIISIFENYCLEVLDGKLVISPYTQSDSQCWILEAVR